MTDDLSPVLDRLEAVASAGRQVAFWWRDDDAVAVTPELDDLLARSARFDVPLALAVIPRDAEPALANRLNGQSGVVVLQHGYAHRNHAPPTAKKAELGAHRPVDQVLGELSDGYRRMSALFGRRFLHVLTPPWNRITPDVARRRKEIGLVGLSAVGHVDEDARNVAHIQFDPIAWHRGRRFIGTDEANAVLVREIDRRLDGSEEPIGLLTHHLVQNAETWAYVDRLLALLTDHRAAVWPSIEEVFDRP